MVVEVVRARLRTAGLVNASRVRDASAGGKVVLGHSCRDLCHELVCVSLHRPHSTVSAAFATPPRDPFRRGRDFPHFWQTARTRLTELLAESLK